MHSYIYIRMYTDTCEAHMERLFHLQNERTMVGGMRLHASVDEYLMECSDMYRRDLSKHI
jgi:hypothetical protein